MSIYRRIKEGIMDAAYVWRQEMLQVFKDEGVLIFFIIVPLVYPLLYSWIYKWWTRPVRRCHASLCVSATPRPMCM